MLFGQRIRNQPKMLIEFTKDLEWWSSANLVCHLLMLWCPLPGVKLSEWTLDLCANKGQKLAEDSIKSQ